MRPSPVPERSPVSDAVRTARSAMFNVPTVAYTTPQPTTNSVDPMLLMATYLRVCRTCARLAPTIIVP